MKKNSVGNLCKDAIGAMFLLAGAFFVGSTLLSMRAVLADPIAPTDMGMGDSMNAQSPRNTNRASPRGNSRTVSAARPTTANAAAGGTRTVASRNVASRSNSNNNASAARTTATRSVVARTATRPMGTTRTVAQRSTTARTVRARTADSDSARIGVHTDAIRGVKGTTSTHYTYLSSKLYSGNYSNIIDSTTGLISADAYSNCLESYYTCMDEICTARSEAQRRCACAGRVKAFAEAESALESANEELIKVSGELALLIANKGKDVSAAFTLTDAEKVMNCASWREVAHMDTTGTAGTGCDTTKMTEWCQSHGEYTNCSCSVAPNYCTNESVYGFDVKNLDGAGSDILASLAKWADDVKESTDTILKTDNDSLLGAYVNMGNLVSGITGSVVAFTEGEVQDTLAETWGYDLFRYAHNNVCARVLDSCFNGIYEGCGTPPSGGRCANGSTSSCPFNYNSKVTISSSGDVTLNERSTAGANASASCFGYTSSSGDPYASLRGPVADARRSVMQKYLLDANADCDLYGDQLKATAQKIAYQKVAAQQALQQKRLEFYNEERDKILNEAIAAGTNFDECLSEIWDCYESQMSNTTNSGSAWPAERIKTYCAQVANVPHCYQDMICNPSTAQFRAIIDVQDDTNCNNSQDYTKNTCRNVVTLNEILRSISDNPYYIEPGGSGDSVAMREKCLLLNGVESIRNWKANVYDAYVCERQSGMVWDSENGVCVNQQKYNCESQSGMVWDAANKSCISRAEYNCNQQSGMIWNGYRCLDEREHNCQLQGMTYSEIAGGCVDAM
ncbi:MAG: hypothetical protein J6T57_03290 [Alphaproteobacteria bacterium]|nr:hypothetical protein [Alphaproteobacteria bacterium]